MAEKSSEIVSEGREILRLKCKNNCCVKVLFFVKRKPPEEAKQDKSIRIVLPFKDQRSADALRRNLNDLNKKIGSDLQPVFTSKKIMDEIKVVEAKPPLINQPCVVYKFSCNLCDSDYVGFTSRHLFQRIATIAEHKYSAIGQHLKEDHKLKGYSVQERNAARSWIVYFTKCSSSGT